MTDSPCPNDSLLWPAVMGDTVEPELQHHIQTCPHCQRRIDSLRGDVDAVQNVKWEPSSVNPASPSMDSLPESIGEYTVITQLGSGGQADVYRAWHPRLKTDVVIKWYRKEDVPDTELSQLASEAHILSQIRHPYLGQVYDVGIEQGRQFIIMEYISGHTLSAWIRRFHPSIARIASVLAQAAQAVDAVHRHGALHLDLKPGNILVDDEGIPRVIDFGMARTHGTGARRSLLLAPGTPEYMSPEQCAGDTGRISEASDVYGLGAVLFSSLCQRPIRSESQMTLEPDWTLIQHVPWTLRKICRKALAIRPQDRYESAASLAKDLERFAERHTILRRGLSVACILAGFASCLWGSVSQIKAPAPAELLIEDHRQYQTKEHLVLETKCSSVLSHQRLPCLMFSTASTNSIRITGLEHQIDAEWRIAQPNYDRAALRVADNAGPYLILSCADRDWLNPQSSALKQQLRSLQALRLKATVRILVSQNLVSFCSTDSDSFPPEEAAQQQRALHHVQDIQTALNHWLPCYSGLVVIPAATSPQHTLHSASSLMATLP